MTRRNSVFFLLIAFLITGPLSTRPPCSAEPPATQPANVPSTAPSLVSQNVARLLNALGSADWHERKRAQEALVLLGEESRPALRQFIDQSADLDASTRAQAALSQIDENRILGPSYVTLHVRDAEAKDVVAELSRQGFCQLKPYAPELWDDKSIPRLTLDLDHQPFWTAMKLVGQQAGLTLQPMADGRRLIRGDFANGLSVVKGPFLISAQQMVRTQMVILGNHPQNISTFVVSIAVSPEPKLVVLGQASPCQVEQAIDDLGNSLTPPASENQGFGGGVGAGVWSSAIRLRWPQNPGQRIKRLVASTSFNVQTRSQKLQIDNLPDAKPRTITLGTSTLNFLGFSQAGDAWDLRISLNGNSPLLQQMSQTQIQVLDEQGRSLNRRMTSGSGDGTSITYTIQFASSHVQGLPVSGAPVRLVWEAPTETKIVPLTFEFDDLPMPQ